MPVYFDEYIEKGLITRRHHPLNEDLVVYNYTARTQFKRLWDEKTRRARGLIVKNGKVIAEPFHKFFNLEETAAT